MPFNTDSEGKIIYADEAFLRLCDNIIKMQGGDNRLFMSFSQGVDALAMLLRCIESEKFDIKNSVFYFYYFVRMSWVDEYLDYIEKKFGIQIIKVPSHIFYECIYYGFFQTPERLKAIRKMKEKGILTIFDKKEIQYLMSFVSGVETFPCAVGVKQGDSPMRRSAMRKGQGMGGPSKWYPIWDFEHRDVYGIIEKYDIKVAFDYELFGISFENIDYRFLKPIKDICPINYQRILDIFPLAESIIIRHEHYRPEWKLKKGIKLGKLKDRILKPINPL